MRQKPLGIWDALIGGTLFIAFVGYAGTQWLGLGEWFYYALAVIVVAVVVYSWVDYIVQLSRPVPGRRHIPAWVRSAVLTRDGYRCSHCGSRYELQIDHITPVSWGGSDELCNLQTLCGPCNRAKSNRYVG